MWGFYHSEGLVGGLVYFYLMRRGQSEKRFNPIIALGVTFFAETLQMVIILALSTPFEDAVALVKVIAVPMMLSNAVGAAMFMSIIRDRRTAYDRFGVIFSAKALDLAERILDLLSKGFNQETATAPVDGMRDKPTRCHALSCPRDRLHFVPEAWVTLFIF